MSSTRELPQVPDDLALVLDQGAPRDALDVFVRAGESASVEDILNELIPNEQALSRAPLVSLLLKAKVQAIRTETAETIAQLQEDQAHEQMSKIQGNIGDLLSQVTGIRDAATESEVVVREITRDIQSLDLAKKNLIASMNALKRFQMLVNAFDSLTRLAQSRRYRETAQALAAVKQLSHFFKSFANVERVAAVSKGVAEVQGVLRAQVLQEFEDAFVNETTRLGKNALLTDAALVVDVLGDEAKNTLLSWYSLVLLRDYRRIFGSASEAGQLDNLSRRFAWFRRVLKTHEDDNSMLFPASWNVGAVLAGGFSEVTKDDLASVLSKGAASLQVAQLLEALQQTTEFEEQLARKWSMPFESVAALSLISAKGPGRATLISAVFEPYLGIVVNAQDKILVEMFNGFTSSRISLSPADNPSAVLPSSSELFYFYREALERCAKLSNRQPLLDLCRVYRKWLKIYAEDILGASLIKFDRRSGEGRPNIQELTTACLVLNTAEYCHETTAQLEEHLRETIHPDFKASVTLEAEKELFQSTLSAAILAILREVELTIEAPFNQMARSPWRDVEIVSSESNYVLELSRGIQTAIGVVREGIEMKKYVRSVCDKLVGLVLSRFTQTIVRCRPIAQTGAEQILLDLQTLKTCLLRLLLAPGDTAIVPISYSRYVSKSILKIDTLLKVVMTPEEPAEEFIKHYLLLIPCQSFTDLQKVLDLKGVRRADQNNLLDIFLARTSTATNLADESFLTNLDMDPRPPPTITSPASYSGSHTPNLFSGAGLGFGAALPAVPGLRSVTPSRGEERTKEALQEFKRLGARIGLSSRLFSSRDRE